MLSWCLLFLLISVYLSLYSSRLLWTEKHNMATRSGAELTTATATPDTQSQFELESRDRWSEEREFESLLPPCDGGKDAWTFLAAAFVIEIMVWGMLYPFKPPNSLMVNFFQASLGPMAYSRNTTAPHSPSPANLVYLLLGPPQWAFSTWSRPSPLAL